MWCIGVLNADYRRRMYDLLELYARPYCEHEPVICIDEKSKQLLKHARPPLSIKPGAPPKDDYEYVRAGTCNVFVALEPKGKRRVVRVTQQRTKPEFVAFVQRLLERTYSSARKVHLVLDNLNTHFRSSFEQVLGRAAAAALLRRVQFHYTPKHASWLNMVEIEIGVLRTQCLDRRIGERERLVSEIDAWEHHRNASGARINWMFTTQRAREKMARAYPNTAKVS
jgi:hypothetical protein